MADQGRPHATSKMYIVRQSTWLRPLKNDALRRTYATLVRTRWHGMMTQFHHQEHPLSSMKKEQEYGTTQELNRMFLINIFLSVSKGVTTS